VDLPILRGDDYVAKTLPNMRIAAIKVDVQGFELEVLKGLEKVIARDRPAIWMEVSDTTRQQLKLGFPVNAPFRVRKFSARTIAGLVKVDTLADASFCSMTERNGDYLIAPE